MSEPELQSNHSPVHDLYKLHESFTNAGAKKGDVYLTKWWGEGKFHFVKKDSGQGRWLTFCRWLGLGKKDEQESFQEAAKFFQKVQEEFYEEVSVEEKTVQSEHLTAVGKALRDTVSQLYEDSIGKSTKSEEKLQFGASRTTQKKQTSEYLLHQQKSFREEAKGGLDILLQKTLHVDEENKKKAVDEAFKALSPNDREFILNVLKDVNVPEVDKCKKLLPVLTDRLLSLAGKRKLDDPEMANLMEVMEKVRSKIPSDRKVLDTNNAPLLFDSLFLRGQGLSANYSWEGFKNPFVGFYQNKKKEIEDRGGKNPFLSPEESEQVMYCDNIISQLQNAVDLTTTTMTADQVRQHVIGQLAQHGKCLLLGGWKNHGTVYAFEKQPNNNVTLKIYDPSQTVTAGKKGGYKQVSGLCRTVENVDLNNRDNFFWESIFTQKAFEALKGDSDTSFETQQKLLIFGLEGLGTGWASSRMPELSASSAAAPENSFFSGLLAWTRGESQDFKVYKHDKYEMKRNLLADYLGEFQKTSLDKILTAEAYNTAVELRTRIRRSLESFTNWISKYGSNSGLTTKEMAEAHRLVQDYRAALVQLDKKLNEFDATQPRSTVSSVKTESLKMHLPDTFDEVGVAEVDEESLSLSRVEELQKDVIDALAVLNEQTKTTTTAARVEGAIHALALHDVPKEQRLYAFREICRKVGGDVQEWQKLRFQDPKQAYQDFRAIVSSLNDDLNSYLKVQPPSSPPADLYFQFFSAQLAMEVAFSQIPDCKGLITEENVLLQTALAQQSVRDKLALLSTSDPLWMAFKESVANLKGTGSLVDIDPQLGQGNLVHAGINWYLNNTKMKEQFTRDILEERRGQWKEVEIQRVPLRKTISDINYIELPKANQKLEEAKRKNQKAENDLNEWQTYDRQSKAWEEFFDAHGNPKLSRTDAPAWRLRPNGDWPGYTVDAVNDFITSCVQYKESLDEYNRLYRLYEGKNAQLNLGSVDEAFSAPIPPQEPPTPLLYGRRCDRALALNWAQFSSEWNSKKEDFNKSLVWNEAVRKLQEAGLSSYSQKPQPPTCPPNNATNLGEAARNRLTTSSEFMQAEACVRGLNERLKSIAERYNSIPGQVLNETKCWSEAICPFDADAPYENINEQSIQLKNLACFLFGNQRNPAAEWRLIRLLNKHSDYKENFYKEANKAFLPPEFNEMCYWQTRALKLLDQQQAVDQGPHSMNFSSNLVTTWGRGDSFEIRGDFSPLNTGFEVKGDAQFRKAHDPYRENLDHDFQAVYDRMYFENTFEEQAIPKEQYDLQGKTGNLEPDTTRAILALKATPDIQVLSTLEYIENNISKVGEGKWQNLFHSLLFDDHLLQKEIQDPQKRKILVSRCKGLLNRAVLQCGQSKSYDALAGVLWLGSSIQRCLDSIGEKPTEPNEDPIFNFQGLESVVDKVLNEGDAKKAQLLFESIAIATSSCFDTSPVDPEMLGLHLFSVVMMNKFPIGITHRCTSRERDLEEANFKRKNYLQKCDSDELTQVLNDKFKANLALAFPALLIGAWKFSVKDGVCEIDGCVKISLSSGEAVSPRSKAFETVPAKKLPADIADLLRRGKFYDKDKDFTADTCKIYPQDDGSTVIHYDDKEKKMHFMFTKDEEGYKTYVQVEDSPMSSWSRFLPNNEDRNDYLSNQALRQNYIHIQSPGQEPEVYLLDPKTSKVVYTCKQMGGENKLTKQSEENEALSLKAKELQVVSVDKNPFAEFEDANYTIFLGDNTGLQRVEFPRMKVQLVRSKGKWHVEGQEDWKLASKQSIPNLRQMSGLLLLENEKGEQRAIFPVASPKEQLPSPSLGEEKIGSWNNPYRYKFPNNPDPIQTVECDVLPTEGRIVPKDYAARFYLAKIYLERGYADEANALMKDILALAPQKRFSAEEALRLTELTKPPISGDRGVRVVRLRMQALALLKTNELQFPEQKTAENAKKEETQEAKTARQAAEQKLKDEKEKVLQEQHTLIDTYLQKTRSVDPIDAKLEHLLLTSLIPEFSKVHLDVKAFEARAKELEHEQIADSPADRTIPPVPSSVPAPTLAMPGIKVAVNLLSLKTLLCDPDGETFLENDVKEKFLDKKKAKVSKGHTGESQLFPENSPEIGNDPARKTQFQKMSKDLDEAKKGMQEVTSFLVKDVAGQTEEDRLESVKGEIHEKLTSASTRLQEMGETITEAVARVLTNPENPRWSEVASKKRSLPSIEELCVHVGCQDYHARMQRLYPELSQTDRVTLRDSIRQYLYQKQFTQRLAGAKDILEKIDEANKEFEARRTDFLQEVKTLSENATKIEKPYLAHRKERMALLEKLKISDGDAKKIEDLYKLRYDLDSLVEKEIGKDIEGQDIEGAVAKRAAAHATARANFSKQRKELLKELNMPSKVAEELEKFEQKYLEKRRNLIEELGFEEEDAQKIEAFSENYHNGTRQILLNDLGKVLEIKRSYAEGAPLEMTILLMETILKICLREDQVKNIEKFAEKALKGEPIALQMIMGAGKTSVLQPMLGYLFAAFAAGSEPRFSSVTLPPALFGKVRDELFKVLGPSFDQLVVVLPYDRFLAKNTEYLKLYLKEVKDAKKRGACELRTPTQKQSVLTSLQEAFHDYEKADKDGLDTTAIQERIDLISQICTFFHENEFGQIDEIDLVMNPERVFTYPVGDTKTVDPDRANAISTILLELANDNDLNSKVRLDFCEQIRARKKLPRYEEAEGLNHTSFIKYVLPALVTHAKTAVKKGLGEAKYNKVFGDEDAEKYLKSFLTNTTDFDEQLRQATGPQAAALQKKRDDFLKERDTFLKENLTESEQKEILGACSYAIVHLMEKAFERRFGEKYGWERKRETGEIVPGRYIARPYDQSTCQPTEFQDPYQGVILMTMQTLFDRIPADAAKKMLESLRARAEAGDVDASTDFLRIMSNSDIKFDLTQPNPTETELEAFREGVSKDDASILQFLKEYGYGQVKISPESLSCTAHAMAGSSKVSVGYTGTQQVGILPRGMEGVPELGTDGKTVLAVERKMTGKPPTSQTLVVSPTKDKSLADMEIDRFKDDKDLFVFIDSGAWLTGEKIPTYCERMLREVKTTRPDIEGVVYLNDEKDGEAWIAELRGNEIVHIPLASSAMKTTSGKVLTIMAQRYETGTNIPQKPDAKADKSVRRGETVRDSLQSIFRMRQILGGQNVNLLLAPEVKRNVSDGIVDGLLTNQQIVNLFTEENVYAGAYEELEVENLLAGCPQDMKDAFKNAFENLCANVPADKDRDSLLKAFKDSFDKNFALNSQAVWRYFNVNQACVEQRKNWLAAQQKMLEIVQRPIRQFLHNTNRSAASRLMVYTKMKALLVETSEDNPFNRMLGKEQTIDAATAIKRKVDEFLKKFDEMQNLSDVRLKNDLLDEFKKCYGPDPSLKENENTTVRERLRHRLNGVVDPKDIPQAIQVTAVSGEAETQTETETEQQKERVQEQEQQQEQETEIEKVPPTEIPPIDQAPLYNPLVNDLSEFFGKTAPEHVHALSVGIPNPLCDYLKDPAKNVEFSDNLFMSRQPPSGNSEDTCFNKGFRSLYYLPAKYVLVLTEDKKPNKYVLVSDKDAADIRAKILNSQGTQLQGHCTLVSLDTRSVWATTAENEESASKAIEADSNVHAAFALAKLCTGDTSMGTREVDALKPFTKVKGAMPVMRDFYEDILLRRDGAMKAYLPSVLNRTLFRRKAKQNQQ